MLRNVERKGENRKKKKICAEAIIRQLLVDSCVVNVRFIADPRERRSPRRRSKGKQRDVEQKRFSLEENWTAPLFPLPQSATQTSKCAHRESIDRNIKKICKYSFQLACTLDRYADFCVNTRLEKILDVSTLVYYFNKMRFTR